MVTRRSRFCSAVASVAVLLACRGVAQSSNDEILVRATRYTDDFFRLFVNVVADEHYVQEVGPPKRRRDIKSEFLLVRPPGSSDWYQFRDVIEVDGKPVRDREQRLTQLFLTPTADAVRRAAQVTEESARFNIAQIGTLNKPLTVLAFLQTTYRSRFRFLPGRLDSKVGPNARVVQFSELTVPTLLHYGFEGLPATGRMWIDDRSGAVLRTELVFTVRNVKNEIMTSFAFDPELMVYAPAEMREQYAGFEGNFTAVATYGHFRRYQVETREHLR
jgi:hypothetical protein